MSSLEEALASSSSAPDIGPAQGAFFASPELLTARSVFLSQQFLESETKESLAAQLERFNKADTFHKQALISVHKQKVEVQKLLDAADEQSKATKQLGRELGYSHKLEQASGNWPAANPLVDWFKSTTRLVGSDVLVELSKDDSAEGESGGTDSAAAYADTLESVAEPRSPAGDAANPEEASQPAWQSDSWEGWSGEEYGGVQHIPVSRYGSSSGLEESDESTAAVPIAETAKKRKLAVPPKTPPPGYVWPTGSSHEPVAVSGPPEKGSVAAAASSAKAAPKPRFPWRR